MSLPVVVAMDGVSLEFAVDLCRKINEMVYAVKIHDLFDRYGGQAVDLLKQAGIGRVWVDYKLHDIPGTVGYRAAALRDAGADIITVHASGGSKMIQAAVKNGPSSIYAITVLTSLTENDCRQIYSGNPEDRVAEFVGIALDSGAHGIVCSPQELPLVNGIPGRRNVKLVTPGIRSAGQNKQDQARISTSSQALGNKADLLVIGRQITEAGDPLAELWRISEEISGKRG